MDNSMTVHFIGIGGAGMSGIAKVLLEMGNKVTGTDLKSSRYTADLIELGADVRIGHGPENLGNPDVVVISSAIPDYNVEYEQALSLGIPVILRAEMLAQIARRKKTIAVAGTHGKTTATSMISFILRRSGREPSFLIGGELNDIGSNANFGKGELCVVEADESDGSLTYLAPDKVVVTNIDTDHLDHYGSFEAIEELFTQWLSRLPKEGLAVVLGDDSNVQRVAEKSGANFITFGLDDSNDYSARDLKLTSFHSEFTACRGGEAIGKISLRLPGVHNVLNALTATAVCLNEGLDLKEISSALSEFNGVKRRFQLVGRKNNVTIIDDYAHHPTEIRSTLEAAGYGGWSRIFCVFQPHRYTRTKLLFREFAEAFNVADFIVMTDIYSAGEEPIPGVTGKLLVDSVLERYPEKNLIYLPNRMEIKGFLIDNIRDNDLVITMGAGDIWTVGEEVLESLVTDGDFDVLNVASMES